MVSSLELHFTVGNAATTGMGFQGGVDPLLWENFPTAHVIIVGMPNPGTIPGYSHRRLDVAPRVPMSLL